MKKKLLALDLRIQIGAVSFLVLLVGIAGYMFVVSPEHAKAAKIQTQIDATQSLIYQRRAQLKKGLHPPTIKTADVFRLARAMPDREDMPGIILTLSDVARQSGITFATIEPVLGGTQLGLAGPFETRRIHLVFNGDFYGLSDFLYRIRSLVAVRDGTLDATGRLFNVDTLTFGVQANQFPQISAELFVDAYVYATAPVTPGAAPTTTTTTPTTDTTSPEGATAAGATP